MADTRINAIATTATASASDDFLPIDGTTNGTRKLSAYSPTFGGDITSNSTSGSNIIANDPTFNHPVVQLREASVNKAAFETVSGNAYISTQTAGKSLYLRSGNATTALTLDGSQNATLAGNLTVSGTGTSSFAGTLGVATTVSPWLSSFKPIQVGTSSIAELANRTYLGANWYYDTSLGDTYIATNFASLYRQQSGDHHWLTAASGTAGTAISFSQPMTLKANGNLLLGTTTDSSNGKLQLATHTTSAGGIGFGPSTSLYTTSAGVLALDYIGGASSVLYLRENGTSKGALSTSAGDLYLETVTAKNVYLRTNSTTALTLDSSQNASFAGNVKVSGALTANSTSAAVLSFQAGQAILSSFGANTSTGGAFILQSLSSNASVNVNALVIDSSQNATFAGTIKPQQAATASAPTYVKGAIYFDTTLNKLRVGGATGWETITSV